eukprot:1412555-Rhodomonas_salina.1
MEARREARRGEPPVEARRLPFISTSRFKMKAAQSQAKWANSTNNISWSPNMSYPPDSAIFCPLPWPFWAGPRISAG